MSITSDIRNYADQAVTEGRKVLDSTLTTAQAQLSEATGNVSSIVEKAGETVAELRTSAEKAINVEAIKSAVEPYVAQARTYQASVADRAEALIADVRKDLRKDPRLARALDVADSVAVTVVNTVEERVVKPVQSLTGRGPAKPAARKPSPTGAARKPATTKPASRSTSASTSRPAAKTAARKTTARKTATKRTDA